MNLRGLIATVIFLISVGPIGALVFPQEFSPSVRDPRKIGLPIFPSMKDMESVIKDLGAGSIPYLRYALQKGTPAVQYQAV